jgi:pimeloyl-ACP methyl ester carboxylesterase
VSQESVTSKDGTPISYWQSGQGSPLVLVHGTAADHGRWAPVLPAFEQRFSVCAIDRRGRGGSGDPEDHYAIEREFEDISTVVDSVGVPAVLLGHSYGALCALETVLLTRKVRKLVLYEPGIEVAGQEIYPQEVIERLETLPGRETARGWWPHSCARSPGCRPRQGSNCARSQPGKRWYQRRAPSRGNCERARLTA